VVCGLGIVAGAALAWTFGIHDYVRLENLARLQHWVGGLGPWAPTGYIFAYVFLELLFVPALPFNILAGIAFGPVWGTVYAWIGATVSAAAAFLITRYGAREAVERWVVKSRRLAQIDAAVADHGWRILAFTRLVPVFPYNLQNYAYGLTGIRFATYVAVSIVFMLPSTVALALAGDALVQGEADLRWLGVYLGIAALLLGVLYVLPGRWGRGTHFAGALAGERQGSTGKGTRNK
jgi:uncharacterized membrane protein YdjX (TVP38/TMEM64 family)